MLLIFFLEVNKDCVWYFCCDLACFINWEKFGVIILIRMLFHDKLTQTSHFTCLKFLELVMHFHITLMRLIVKFW